MSKNYKIEFQCPLDEVQLILKEISSVKYIDTANIKEKRMVQPGFLNRKPQNQIEIVELIVEIIISIGATEAYQMAKEQIKELLREKKIEIKSENKSDVPKD